MRKDPSELLLALAEQAGMELNAYLQNQTFDSVCDGACLHCGELYESGYEPDARDCMCEECQTPNVMSSVELMMMS